MRKSPIFAAVLLAAACSVVQAKDYGVQGTVWEITEVDVRQLLMTEVANADWEGPRKEMEASAHSYLDNLPKRQMPEPSTNTIAWVDPSFTLEEDIKVPYKGLDGKYAWRILHKAGTKVNPLDRIQPATAMLFFDGSVPEQVKLVKQALALEPNRVVPVEAGAGNLKDVNEELGRGAFHADDALLKRFEIRYLPTLMYPGSGAKKGFVELSSFARPFDAGAVIRSWPSLTRTAPKN